jgi:DNA-binding HxlR family transcriptional regulator
MSPVELARLLAEPQVSLGAMAYHVKKLAAAGVIKPAGTIQRRGAVEHRYSLTDRGRTVAELLDELSIPSSGSPPSGEGGRGG